MTLTTVLNLVLAIGVIVMVVTPLAWAILTQSRDDPRSAVAEGPALEPPDPQPSEPTRREAQPKSKAVARGVQPAAARH
jgi:hypothetical protein